MTNTYTTLRGNIVSINETGTHCYMWPEGRENERVRIKKAEYEQVIREDELERKLVAEQEAAEAEVEAAVEAVEESETTEEINQISMKYAKKFAKKFAEEMSPKKKRTRKSKDIAFAVTVDGVETTLTAKQVDFIRHLPDTCFWERGLDSALWTDVLADEIGGQFAGKPMTTGAMISTLCEKGLGVRAKERVNNRNCTSFRLTGLGKVIAAELGLN